MTLPKPTQLSFVYGQLAAQLGLAMKTPLVLRHADTVGRKMATLLKQSNSCQSVSLTQLCSDACRGAQSGQMDQKHAGIFVWP